MLSKEEVGNCYTRNKKMLLLWLPRPLAEADLLLGRAKYHHCHRALILQGKQDLLTN